MRHQLQVTLKHMGARHRIDGAIDKAQGHPFLLHGAHPTFTMNRPLWHVSDQFVQDPRATIRCNQAPTIIQRAFTGTGARAIDLGDMAHQVVAPEGACHQPAQSAEQ
ncbi:hypothetical protein D3C81_1771980 [compost metagenome]